MPKKADYKAIWILRDGILSIFTKIRFFQSWVSGKISLDFCLWKKQYKKFDISIKHFGLNSPRIRDLFQWNQHMAQDPYEFQCAIYARY